LCHVIERIGILGDFQEPLLNFLGFDLGTS